MPQFLDPSEVLDRMEVGDMPTSNGKTSQVKFSDGRRASAKTMEGLEKRSLIHFDESWQVTACPRCGKAKIAHVDNDPCFQRKNRPFWSLDKA